MRRHELLQNQMFDLKATIESKQVKHMVLWSLFLVLQFTHLQRTIVNLQEAKQQAALMAGVCVFI